MARNLKVNEWVRVTPPAPAKGKADIYAYRGRVGQVVAVEPVGEGQVVIHVHLVGWPKDKVLLADPKNLTRESYQARWEKIHERRERIPRFSRAFLQGKRSFSDYDRGQLRSGIEIEKEHKDLWEHLRARYPGFDMSLNEFAKWIAGAHLEEIPDYYTRLKKMEDQAWAEGSASQP
jgi:hypothetical protein